MLLNPTMNKINLSDSETEQGYKVGQFYLIENSVYILAEAGVDSYGDVNYCLVSLETGRPLNSTFDDTPKMLMGNVACKRVVLPFQVIPN